MMNPLVKAAIDLLIVLPMPKSQIEISETPQQCNQFLHLPEKNKDVAFWMHLVPNHVVIKHGLLEHPHPPFIDDLSSNKTSTFFGDLPAMFFFRRVSESLLAESERKLTP